MNLEDFNSSITAGIPPDPLDPCLLAMWYEKSGDWNKAHEIVQEIDTEMASLVHAYLHRREGDDSNARYWYGRAGRRFPDRATLDDEWLSLTGELLAAAE